MYVYLKNFNLYLNKLTNFRQQLKGTSTIPHREANHQTTRRRAKLIRSAESSGALEELQAGLEGHLLQGRRGVLHALA